MDTYQSPGVHFFHRASAGAENLRMVSVAVSPDASCLPIAFETITS